MKKLILSTITFVSLLFVVGCTDDTTGTGEGDTKSTTLTGGTVSGSKMSGAWSTASGGTVSAGDITINFKTDTELDYYATDSKGETSLLSTTYETATNANSDASDGYNDTLKIVAASSRLRATTYAYIFVYSVKSNSEVTCRMIHKEGSDVVGATESFHPFEGTIVVTDDSDNGDGTDSKFSGKWLWMDRSGLDGVTYDFLFVTDQMGFVTADSGVIYKTIDGGKSFKAINAGSGRLMKEMTFPTTSVGYLPGGDLTADSIVFYKTIDGGENWTAMELTLPDTIVLDYDPQLYLHFISDTIGFASIEGLRSSTYGPVMKTIDGGVTWNVIDRYGSFHKILTRGEDTIVTVAHGYVHRSIDGGQKWHDAIGVKFLGLSAISITDMIFVDNETLLGVCGGIDQSKGILHISKDCGINFEAVAFPKSLESVALKGDMVYVVGPKMYMARISIEKLKNTETDKLADAFEVVPHTNFFYPTGENCMTNSTLYRIQFTSDSTGYVFDKFNLYRFE